MTVQRLIDKTDAWILNLSADARAFLVNITQFLAWTLVMTGWGNLTFGTDPLLSIVSFVMALVSAIVAFAVVEKIHDDEFEKFKKGTIHVVIFEMAMTAAAIPIFIMDYGITMGGIMCIGPVFGILESVANYQTVKNRVIGGKCHQ